MRRCEGMTFQLYLCLEEMRCKYVVKEDKRDEKKRVE